MPNLTNDQATQLWNNAFKKAKVFVNGVFETIRVHSNLDGFSYYIDSKRQTIAIDENSSEAQVETASIDYWENNQEYLGTDPIGKESSL